MCRSQQHPLFTVTKLHFHINEFSICLLSDYAYRFILIQINIPFSDYIFLPWVSSHTDIAGTKQSFHWHRQAQPSLRARVLTSLKPAQCGWNGSPDSEGQSLFCTGWEQEPPHKCKSLTAASCAAVGCLNISSCTVCLALHRND